MERSFYGFKPVKLSTVEIAYNPDCSLSHYYIQMSRNDYPCNVYIKLSTDNEILEFYPIYIGSCKNSINIITKNIRYLGHYDYRYYAYLSWDLENEPTEIYLQKGPDYIEKYKNQNLDAKYYRVSIDKIDECEDLNDETRKFVKESGADIFMYVTKNGIFKKFCLIYNFMNEKYLEKRKMISAFQDTWT